MTGFLEIASESAAKVNAAAGESLMGICSSVDVGFRKGCALSTLLSIIYMKIS